MAYKNLSQILLVDDNDDTNFFHKLILEELALAEHVREALDGLEALAFFEADPSPNSSDAGIHRPELVFLDVNMPKMNGWEFLEAFQELPEERREGVVIVMLSSHHDLEDEQKALSFESVQVYMEKPLTDKKLRWIMKSFFSEEEKVALAKAQ